MGKCLQLFPSGLCSRPVQSFEAGRWSDETTFGQVVSTSNPLQRVAKKVRSANGEKKKEKENTDKLGLNITKDWYSFVFFDHVRFDLSRDSC